MYRSFQGFATAPKNIWGLGIFTKFIQNELMSFEEQITSQRLRNVLASQAFKYTSNRESAQDLLQDTQLKMLEKKAQFSGGDLVPWAFQIMKTTFIDTYRRQTTQQIDTDGEVTRVRRFSQFEDKEEEQIADQSSLEDEISEKQYRDNQSKNLHFCISKLDDTNRTIVILKEEYKYANIAEKLGFTEVNIRQRMRRIYEALRKCMEQFK